MGFFMNANAHTYGRFGGRDAGEAEGHLTISGLRYAMERALATYRTNPDAPGPPPAPPRRVEQNPLVAEQIAAPECIHCHHVYEYRRAALRKAGRWHNAMAWVYPWPENLGLTVEVDQPDHIQKVKAGSAAATAGMRAGDRVKTLNGDPIASYGDIQYALQRAPAEGSIPIRWEQNGQERTATLVLAKGWRETDLSWRASMWRLSPAPSVEGQDLTPEQKAQLGLSADHLAFRQYDMVWPNAKAAGIQGGDIIVGIDGKPLTLTMMQFLIYIRMHYQAGDRVVFNLYRNGQRMGIPMVLRDNP
jgi:predicted metalloprotease with PDZ domain